MKIEASKSFIPIEITKKPGHRRSASNPDISHKKLSSVAQSHLNRSNRSRSPYHLVKNHLVKNHLVDKFTAFVRSNPGLGTLPPPRRSLPPLPAPDKPLPPTPDELNLAIPPAPNKPLPLSPREKAFRDMILLEAELPPPPPVPLTDEILLHEKLLDYELSPPPNKPLPPTPDELSLTTPPAPNKPLPPTPDELSLTIPPAPNKPLPLRPEFSPYDRNIYTISELEEEDQGNIGSDHDHEEIVSLPKEELLSEAERRVNEYLLELSGAAPVIKGEDFHENSPVKMTHHEEQEARLAIRERKIASAALKRKAIYFPVILVGSLFHSIYKGCRTLRGKPYDISRNEEEIKNLKSTLDRAKEKIADIGGKLEKEIDSHLNPMIDALKSGDNEYQKLLQEKKGLNLEREQKKSELSLLEKEFKDLIEQQEGTVEQTEVSPEIIATTNEKTILSLKASIKDIRDRLTEKHLLLQKIELDIKKEARSRVLREIRDNPKIQDDLDRHLITREKVNLQLERLNKEMSDLLKKGKEILRERRFFTTFEKVATFDGRERTELLLRLFNLSININPDKYTDTSQLPITLQNQMLKTALLQIQQD